MGNQDNPTAGAHHTTPPPEGLYESEINALICAMTLSEKIGQLNQVNAEGPRILEQLGPDLVNGKIGSILNQVDPEIVREMQHLARKESRLGIPLLVARDVIHGFKHVSPIPLGQAATFNPAIIEQCARISAIEARLSGINWAFSPMIDVSRDPRWGRIAESFGEDPYLNSVFGVAMIKGLQGEKLDNNSLLAACAKHFVGYGASEGGRDYNTTNIPENELRNIYLKPFKAAVDCGVASFMTSFSDLDGVPATANDYLLTDILRGEWGFDGIVVSDWDAISQLIVHGIAENAKKATELALNAGVDMDMESHAFSAHLEELFADKNISIDQIDQAVANVLRIKFKLGLFKANESSIAMPTADSIRTTLKEAAVQSMVLVKNSNNLLPLVPKNLSKLSLIGPLIDAPNEQLGTWVFDGDPALTVTPLKAANAMFGDILDLHADRAMETSRSRNISHFDYVAKTASTSDAIILCLGEEAILSGEAHCRADISLPGAQEELIDVLYKTGRPIIAVIMAGRPIIVSNILDKVDALIYAWHPGTMGGEALMELLTGTSVPSGRLPVTIPKSVGQIPIYYNHKNTGRPADPARILQIDQIEKGASQTSFGMTSFYLDAGFEPQFPFGFGLGYSEIAYSDLSLSETTISCQDKLKARVSIKNKGKHPAVETVQLYIRDVFGSITRPVKELKDFKRVALQPNEVVQVSFDITNEDLKYTNRDGEYDVEPGEFELWIGPDASCVESVKFELL